MLITKARPRNLNLSDAHGHWNCVLSREKLTAVS